MAAEFKIARLRFNYLGDWSAGSFYNKDAVVTYEGKTYVCLVPHSAGTDIDAFYQALYYQTPGGADDPYWELVLDGRTWTGVWQQTTFYNLGNIVSYGGGLYICTTAHQSGSVIDVSKFVTYGEFANWTGGTGNANWQTSTAYGIGDIVKYGGIVYLCNTSHVSNSNASNGLEVDQGNWTLINNGVEYKGIWSSSSYRYRKNDLVNFGPDIWIAQSGHTSTTAFDQSKWTLWIPGIEYVSTWASATVFQPGDVVKYGGYSYTSKVANNLGNVPSTSLASWELLTTGYNAAGQWAGGTNYKVGDVVQRHGSVYAANQDNQANDPSFLTITTSYVELDSVGTTVKVASALGLIPGLIIVGAGFTVGQSIVQVIDSSTVQLNLPPDGTPVDGQAITFTGISPSWDMIIPGIAWYSFWEITTTYVVGDIVVWKNGTYKCVSTHISVGTVEEADRPDLDITNSYWIPFSLHARRNALTNQGDILTFTNGSTLPLPIGETDQVLVVTDGDTPTIEWKQILVTPKVYYVAQTGEDRADYGTTWDRPWKTINYAATTVKNGTEYPGIRQALSLNRDYLVAEMYQWMLYQKANSLSPFSPSSVFDPTRTQRDARFIIDALVYDVSRVGNSQTVAAALAFFKDNATSTFINDAVDAQIAYFIAALNYLKTLIINNALAGVAPTTSYQALNNVATPLSFTTGFGIQPTALVTELLNIVIDALTNQTRDGIPLPNQGISSTIMVKTGTYPETLPIVVPAQVAIVGDELRGVVVQPALIINTFTTASSASTNKFTVYTTDGMYDECPVQFVRQSDFISNLTGTVGGTGIVSGVTYYVIGNTITPTTFSVSTSPGGTAILLQDVLSGGFNQVIGGDALQDMFRMRNASGLRNLTLSGLLGTLTAENEFFTSRPTGGAFVALDPGTGTTDTSAWIQKRSPYLQNITLFGQGCSGMKCDGTLHGGGNKSMTANDFTCIISDGIGAWITGSDSKAELISVFSYYCYTSYFAEDGGRIRAANGNSSYGVYGCIAEGYDDNESPITGNIDNRTTQATASVQQAYGVDANILKLDYLNAGSEYNQATTNLITYSNNFIGAGWSTDGNITLQQNIISPSTYNDGWTVNGLTSNSDSAYLYQNVTISPTGATYTNLQGSNVSGSGSAASFDVTVNATSYAVVVSTLGTGGTGYVLGNQITIYGSQVGGIDGLNDITLTVASLVGSTIITVSAAGTVPAGSALPYTLSIYAKQGTAISFDLYAIYSGTSTRTSYASFNFLTETVTTGNGGDGGFTPINKGVDKLTDGWYRVWFSAYDTNALNNNLQFRIYPRTQLGTSGYSYFYGSQVEIGSTPGFYLTTTTGRYTAFADYVISGAGVGAVIVADETRSQSVYETRITDLTGSGAGGTGYRTSSNNASGGDTSFILLSGADIGTSAEYNGMKLYINSGTGAGQYGFISNYDADTKTAYICKESVVPLSIITSDGTADTFTVSTAVTNENTAFALYVDQPVQFFPTYYGTDVLNTSRRSIAITNITGGTTNTMNTADTSALYYNMAVTFSGTGTTGGVVENFTYYIYDILDPTTFQVSAEPFGNVLLLNTIIPTDMYMDIPTSSYQLTTSSTSNMLANMPIQFTGTALGGITLGNVYYINDVISSTAFTISLALVTSNVTTTTAGTGAGILSDRLTVSSTSNFVPLNPIVFNGEGLGGLTTDTKYYISNIISNTQFSVSDTILNVSVTNTEFGTNLITCNSTSGFVIDNPIKFSGNSFGGINNETTYYILAINDGATFAVSTSKGASSISLQTASGVMTGRTCSTATAVGNDSGTMGATTTSSKFVLSTSYGTMNAVFSTPIFGGVTRGTTYYVRTINTGANTFSITNSPGGATNVGLTHGTGTMQMGEVGWDHVNSGTPPEGALDSTSLYYIEPRLTYSSPGFSQTATTMPSLTSGATHASIAYGANYWLSVPDGGNQVFGTGDGVTWDIYTLPTTPTSWSGVAYGNTVWLIISTGNDKVLYSFANGQSWKATTMPSSSTWSSVVYGAGNFVALATGTTKAAYSTTFGATWSAATLPGAAGNWANIAYGNNRFVTVATTSTRAAYSTDKGQTWTASTLPGASAGWSSIAYGSEKFVAVSNTSRAPVYSFDGITWYTSNYSFAADEICYGNGVFIALSSGTTVSYTSEDGIFWRRRTVTSATYKACAFGFTETQNTGVFFTTSDTTTGSAIITGAKTKGRPIIETGVINSIKLFETGGGYSGIPTVSIFDPNATSVATTLPRLGNGVLSAPTFINRGLGYNTSSTVITINGSGYADQYQVGLSVIMSNITQLPRPGDDLTIDGDDIIYKVTSATIINGTAAPDITAIIQISPPMSIELSPDHDVDIIIREKYSQVRLTNHDFLNVGYGSQPESGYPSPVPVETSLQAQNQTIENNFGRVFYTSTDQDGNFKVGNLFGVEQATGIVTLSASQFGLSGLDKLSLGGIAVGGSSVVVTQFSTDSTFVANSDQVIPTQKAIKSYLSARLSQGGSNTFTGQTTAGTVVIGGPNIITNTIPQGQAGSAVQFTAKANFFGVDENGIGLVEGNMLALDFFIKGGTKR